MKNNCLYSTLMYLITQDKKFKLGGKINPQLAQTSKETHYFLLPFSITNAAVEPYTLIEAHLSIYELVALRDITLSAAHFTALFALNQFQYRLHVYLNDNDIINEIHWDKCEKGKFTKSIQPTELDDLIYIILENGLPYLRDLREKQNEITERLTKDYELKEVSATESSQRLKSHPGEYLGCIEAALVPLKTLAAISTNPQWHRLVIYFSRMINIVTKMQQHAVKLNVNQEIKVITKNTPLLISSVKEKKKEISPKTATNAIHNNHQFVNIIAIHETLVSTQDIRIKINLLINLRGQLSHVLDDQNETFTTEQINRLHQLELETLREAKKTLEMLLITGNFSIAEEMRGFFSLASNELLTLAIIKRNIPLLNFLINKMNFPIETYPFNIKGEKYRNAMEYCYLNVSNLNHLDKVMACLVKNGASIVHSVEPGGLPMAHFILSAKPPHLLLNVLKENAEKTLNNKGFYKQMIRICQRYLDQNQMLPQTQRNALEMDVQFYQAQFKKASLENKLFLPQTKKASEEMVDSIRNLLGISNEELLRELKKDPDIIKMQNTLQDTLKVLIKKSEAFTRKYRNGKLPINSLANKSFDLLKEEALKSKLEDFNQDYFKLKINLLSHYEDTLRYYTHSLELIELQTHIMKTPQLGKKQSRQLKELLAKEKELIGQVKKYSELLPHNMIKAAANYPQEDLKSVNALNNDLGNFKQLISSSFSIFQNPDLYVFLGEKNEENELEFSHFF